MFPERVPSVCQRIGRTGDESSHAAFTKQTGDVVVTESGAGTQGHGLFERHDLFEMVLFERRGL